MSLVIIHTISNSWQPRTIHDNHLVSNKLILFGVFLKIGVWALFCWFVFKLIYLVGCFFCFVMGFFLGGGVVFCGSYKFVLQLKLLTLDSILYVLFIYNVQNIFDNLRYYVNDLWVNKTNSTHNYTKCKLCYRSHLLYHYITFMIFNSDCEFMCVWYGRRN